MKGALFMNTYQLELDVIQSNLQEIGALLRKLRKEQGMRLEDVADENISSATVSNIERATGKYKLDRVIYLLKKFEIEEELLAILSQEKDSRRSMKYRIEAIETYLKLRKDSVALEKIEEIKISDHHVYAPWLYYLKGKCLRRLGRLPQSDSSFLHAIKLTEDASKWDNIEAACYLELGYTMYSKRNDLEKALVYTEKGIDSFMENGNSQYSKLIGKMIYIQIK